MDGNEHHVFLRIYIFSLSFFLQHQRNPNRKRRDDGWYQESGLLPSQPHYLILLWLSELLPSDFASNRCRWFLNTCSLLSLLKTCMWHEMGWWQVPRYFLCWFHIVFIQILAKEANWTDFKSKLLILITKIIDHYINDGYLINFWSIDLNHSLFIAFSGL